MNTIWTKEENKNVHEEKQSMQTKEIHKKHNTLLERQFNEFTALLCSVQFAAMLSLCVCIG